MNQFIGMAPEKGTAAAETIEGKGKALALASEDIAALVTGTSWVGEDREAFLADYASAAELVDTFHQALVTEGGILREQASAQATASSSQSSSAVATHGSATAR